MRMWLEDIDKNAKKARDKRIFDAWMACYSQEEIGEKEGVSKMEVSRICNEMAELPKSYKSYADFDLTLKGEDYDKEGVEGKEATTPLTETSLKKMRRKV